MKIKQPTPLAEKQEFLKYIFQDHKNPEPYSLRLFGKVFFSIYHHNKFGWFRLFGKGLKWKDTSIHHLIFSERFGYTKGIMIGNWRVSFLRDS